jgi:pilus assembly protein Flp/PilA
MGFLKGCSLRLRRLYSRDDRGATAVEYGLMVTLIAVAIVVSASLFGLSARGLFERIVSTSPFN